MKRLLTGIKGEAGVRVRFGTYLVMKPLLASVITLLSASVSSAADISDSRSLYVGAFGGVGSLGDVSMQQVGTVITP